MTFYSETDIYDDLVQLTAEFRFRICWCGTRDLFVARGIDPSKCVVLGVDQGDDVNLVLMLPDGRIADTHAREDPETRQSTHFESFDIIEYSNRETALATSVIRGERPDFDADVVMHFEQNWRNRDRPLPPRSSLH